MDTHDSAQDRPQTTGPEPFVLRATPAGEVEWVSPPFAPDGWIHLGTQPDHVVTPEPARH